jgi:hypothetical protein
MINLTINDATQKAILPHLQITEELLSSAILYETGIEGSAEIIAMPDLGLASNSIRMRGGFFTGMYAKWQSSIPFIPIDATINSCGVYVFTLRDIIDRDTFLDLIQNAKNRINKLRYSWNFERGNHFINIGTLDNGTPCVVMHASADEYKKKNVDALYPTEQSWYFDSIKTYYSESCSGRYLRYITGTKAERFINIASSIEEINRKRMQEIAHLIFNNLINEELLFVSHYGMPTESSLAIGCSWKSKMFTLLTAPRKDIYIIKPTADQHTVNTGSTNILYPHGLGVMINDPKISYHNGTMTINGVNIDSDYSVSLVPFKQVRMQDTSDYDIMDFVQNYAKSRECQIAHVIKPTMSLNSVGVI